jgi:hypothetical protein
MSLSAHLYITMKFLLSLKLRGNKCVRYSNQLSGYTPDYRHYTTSKIVSVLTFEAAAAVAANCANLDGHWLGSRTKSGART